MYYIFISIVLIYYSLISAQETSLPYNPTRLILKFSESSEILYSILTIPLMDYTDKIEIQDAINQPKLFSFLIRYKISSLKPATISSSFSHLSSDIKRIYFIDFKENDELEWSFQRLSESTEFEYVEYDWIGSGGGLPGSSIPGNQKMIIPNDPGFDNQWSLKNTGQIIGGQAGTPGADINMTSAWDISTGNENTIISVLDSGIPLSAAEFSGRLLPGYDFVNNDFDPTDDLGHGTNVTSIIAATGNNSLGMAGINWNCKIIPIKILNSTNFGYYSWWISGISMAVDSSARVINMSVGGSSFSQGLQDAVNYALNSGAVIVACMMNDNNEVTYYPAGFNNIISVGALNNIDHRAVPFCWGGGSNYGNHIDFVAPGNLILGLNYQDPMQTNYWCGTSQATPMVTGLISLMLGLDPSLSLQQIYDILKLFAHDEIGNPVEDTPGWDKYYGWGRIDAYEVIHSIVTDLDVPEVTLLTFTLLQNYPNPFNPSTKISWQSPVGSWQTLKVYDVLGNEVATLVDEYKPEGRIEVEWDASSYPSGVYFYKLQVSSLIETKKMILLK